jgi:hypothetical protein
VIHALREMPCTRRMRFVRRVGRASGIFASRCLCLCSREQPDAHIKRLSVHLALEPHNLEVADHCRFARLLGKGEIPHQQVDCRQRRQNDLHATSYGGKRKNVSQSPRKPRTKRGSTDANRDYAHNPARMSEMANLSGSWRVDTRAAKGF